MSSKMGAPQDCGRCPALVRVRKQVINGVGNPNARIVFVGEGPGRVEDEKGRPFVGKAGKVLGALQWAAGISREECFYSNATRCWGKRNPTPDEVDNCHDYLIEEILSINPAVVVALGGPALHSLYEKNTLVSDVMGFTLWNPELPGIPILPSYHPSFVMRGNWNKVALVLAHFRKAKRVADAGGVEEAYGSYTGITTLEELRGLRDYLLTDHSKILSFDCETTDLPWLDAELLCVSFSIEEGVGYSVPILHRGKEFEEKKGRPTVRGFYTEPFWDLDREMPEVINILEQILSSPNPKAAQNGGFDLRFLERSTSEKACTASTTFGFHVENFQYDTRVMSSLLSESLPANLTVLNALHLDLPYYEQGIVPYKKKMWHLPDKELWAYGGADVDAVTQLVPKLYPRLQEEGLEWLYNNISIPLIRCAANLEERGIQIDLDYFDRLCLYYKDKLVEVKGELKEQVGREVDKPTYYRTVQKLLFEELGLPLTSHPTDKAKQQCKECRAVGGVCSPGHASTSITDLREIAFEPVVSTIIELKTLEKLSGTNLDGGSSGGFRRYIREDGRIHPHWNAGGAYATGRFSCERPNVQNPPKGVIVDSEKYDIHSTDAIRAIFIAPPGYTLLNADWKQLEVWVMAYETGDKVLMDVLLSGRDVHVFVGQRLCELGISHLFPKEAGESLLSDEDWQNKYPEIRDRAKVFTFGINYQLTEQGAADRLGCSLEEAGALFQVYLSSIFPALPDYFARIRQELFSRYAIPNRFGRWRHFPEIPILSALQYRWDMESIVRQGANFPPQAGGHDLHSLAHTATERELFGLVHPVLEMHDSLLTEIPEDRVGVAASSVKSLWEGVARNTILSSGEKLGWAIPISVQCGRNFGGMEEV